MSKRQEIMVYTRVGSEKQIGKQLSEIRNEIVVEEQNMKDLAAKFLASSERYNTLRSTQRSLTAQMFMSNKNYEIAKKRG